MPGLTPVPADKVENDQREADRNARPRAQPSGVEHPVNDESHETMQDERLARPGVARVTEGANGSVSHQHGTAQHLPVVESKVEMEDGALARG